MLFVGRHYRRKRVDVLLRAAALLRGRFPGLAVRIVGNGPCVRRGAGWRRTCGDGTVTWQGDVSRAELAAEYNRAAVFCLPSVQEGFGIVLLEAMAANRPIVAAGAAAIPEVAPHAALVEPDCAEALAEGIAQMHDSPERRAAMGARAGCTWSSTTLRWWRGPFWMRRSDCALSVLQRDGESHFGRRRIGLSVDDVGGLVGRSLDQVLCGEAIERNFVCRENTTETCDSPGRSGCVM